MRLSVGIIAKDEEDRIRPALESSRFADEIIVLDAQSTDRTAELCREFGAKVFVEPWRGYVNQKNRLFELCSGKWILNIDADERVSEQLAREITATVDSRPSCSGYTVRRKTVYLGRWIRHCGWYPDRKLRLVRKESARWTGGRVHEECRVEGRVKELKGDLLHYTYRGISDQLARMNRYTALSARDRLDRGKRAGWTDFLLAPPAAFLKRYFLKGGFLDGVPGFIICFLSMVYVFLKAAKLWELERTEAERASEESADG